jgi:predicted transcriptional regulator YdeE
VCGYSVETTLEQNDRDVSALYSNFFENEKEASLMKLKGSKKGYYGLIWNTKRHERYCYLLGMEIEQDNIAPKNSILKKITKTTYAVAVFQMGEDILRAWTEFYYYEIPKVGFKVNEEHNFYFEYYPTNVNEEFELWVPVLKDDV